MLGKLTKSKVVSDNVTIGNVGKLNMGKHGTNSDTFNVPFMSGTKGVKLNGK